MGREPGSNVTCRFQSSPSSSAPSAFRGCYLVDSFTESQGLTYGAACHAMVTRAACYVASDAARRCKANQLSATASAPRGTSEPQLRNCQPRVESSAPDAKEVTVIVV